MCPQRLNVARAIGETFVSATMFPCLPGRLDLYSRSVNEGWDQIIYYLDKFLVFCAKMAKNKALTFRTPTGMPGKHARNKLRLSNENVLPSRLDQLFFYYVCLTLGSYNFSLRNCLTIKGIRVHCYCARNSCHNVTPRHKSSKRAKEEVQALRIYLRVQTYSLK